MFPPLYYHSPERPLRWSPTLALCLTISGPLHVPEHLTGSAPDDQRTLRDALRGGYTTFVQLEPGDATRYGLMLQPLRNGAVLVLRMNGSVEGALRVRTGAEVTEEDARVLAPHASDGWTRRLLAWWLSILMEAPV